jgi:hypothetical protein
MKAHKVDVDKAIKSFEEAYNVKLTPDRKKAFSYGYAFGVADCYLKLKELPQK